MKKILFAFAMLLAMAACTTKPTEAADNNGAASEVAFEVAKNYFFKNNVDKPSVKITTEEDFSKFFGMATTMGEEGKPTAIDFAKQFVVAVVLPKTDNAMEINPVKVETKGDSLFYSYDVAVGEKQSFTIVPLSIIILDKEYEGKEVVLVNDQNLTYRSAIDRYLVTEIGSQYSQAEHCVPFYSIVDTDEGDAEDIKVWGDFWVLNYNQVGDTLQCVSGGNHSGLMHLRQTEKGYEVTAFDQVADGADLTPSAKKIFGEKYEAFSAINSDEGWREQVRIDKLADYVAEHNLTAVCYQDYGRPAMFFIFE